MEINLAIEGLKFKQLRVTAEGRGGGFNNAIGHKTTSLS